jgi:hypothetical protein
MHLILGLVNNGSHLLFLEARRLLFNVRNRLYFFSLDEPRLENCGSALSLLIQIEVINRSDYAEEILRAFGAEAFFLPSCNQFPDGRVVHILKRGVLEQ